jgi:hypothetical protein
MFRFSAGLSGPAYQTAFRLIARMPDFRAEPAALQIGHQEQTLNADWRLTMEESSNGSWVYWRPEVEFDQPMQIDLAPGSENVMFAIPHRFATLPDALAILEPLPFETVSLGKIFNAGEWNSRTRRLWGFSRSHLVHGWGCAFRGAGHDRLVSRRWLDFGPWRVTRRPNDTTFIQFHDLAITDPDEAYAQAKIGHERMGISQIGGFIQRIDHEGIAALVQGVYRPGATVEQHAMLGACQLRLHHRRTKPIIGRVDTIAYVFIDRADAEAHLHELWLRELECWYVDERGKHRLDADYRPTPNPPAWVRALSDS